MTLGECSLLHGWYRCQRKFVAALAPMRRVPSAGYWAAKTFRTTISPVPDWLSAQKTPTTLLPATLGVGAVSAAQLYGLPVYE